MDKNDVKSQLLSSNKNSRREIFGKTITIIAMIIIIIVVVAILFFVAQKGLLTFFENKVNPLDFLAGQTWNPIQMSPDGKPLVGALPMFTGSLIVTLMSALIAAPVAIGAGIFMTEISPKYGRRILQPVIELLVGIPSVVYGFIGLVVVVPFIRKAFGGSGYGILAGVFVLFVMILPTVTSMTVDALRSVPGFYKEASLGLGATRWQTIWRVLLRAATPGILTAVIFGMARAFGEALAVQMVIGGALVMPTSLTKPASTLTSVLTSQMGNATPGISLNSLWTLALLLLIMALVFNMIMRWIASKGNINK
ncbi:phosphate ABC transporter permease subunit PstC [Lactovum miscens]|uniref:Phosphate transport system permease protein n=1 Tax=Lactovum miscens TaxID=190387 RepID=A0A841C400_9LACT|nr:phosphate ABC transporter permease subunit PstC [Lactovum miscens]MBB5887543.1 phosphate transport system permease protein [Lactovum miscens]